MAVTDEPPRPWWSFGKTVLAAVALTLVRDGRLALDAPLAPQRWTLRQLLQHRAGLPDYGGLPDYHAAVAAGAAPWPLAELQRRSGAPRFAPGAGWAYSNLGYAEVAALVERAAGAPLADALRVRVLHPLGAGSTRLADAGDAGRVAGAPGYHPGWVAHGLLLGPLAEAERVLAGLLGGALLPPALQAALLDAHPLGGPIAGRPWTAPGYALGLMCGRAAGPQGERRIAGHTGGGPGSVVAVYADLDARPLRVASAFAAGADEGAVERAVLARLG